MTRKKYRVTLEFPEIELHVEAYSKKEAVKTVLDEYRHGVYDDSIMVGFSVGDVECLGEV